MFSTIHCAEYGNNGKVYLVWFSHLLLLSPANLLVNSFIGGAALVLIHLGGVIEDIGLAGIGGM